MKTLEITSYIGCPNICKYCPQETLISAYLKGPRKMSFNDFKKILSNVPKDVRIDFSGFSEIFVHPEGALFIKYAIESGYQVALYTTLVGFTESDLENLRGLKFNIVSFHEYDGVDINDFNRKKEIFIREIQEGGCAIVNNPHSRAGNVYPTEKKKGKFHCSVFNREFNHNVVLPNGDVYLCCMDYGLKHNIGNLLETNFDELNRQSIVMLSHIYESDCLCRNCDYVIMEV